MTDSGRKPHARRWVFTWNMQDEDARNFAIAYWGLGPLDGPHGAWQKKKNEIIYIHFQEECGENGTHHLQGCIIMKSQKELSWMRKWIGNNWAHFEIMRGTAEEADDYCRKQDTKVKDGLEFTYGKLPDRKEAPSNKEVKAMVIEQLDEIKEIGFKRPREIPSAVLAQPGFLAAYKTLTAAELGPNRGELKILTLCGDPGLGKSYAINKYFPRHARCMKGNSGIWFQNPLEDVCIFEEFDGSAIDIQRMKQLLDPYPNALEIKGATVPAMYTKVIITSNIPPRLWYKDLTGDPNAGSAAEKRALNIKAIYDRIGYSGGGYIPVRSSGTYCECPAGLNVQQARDWFDIQVREWAGIQDDPQTQPAQAAAAAADLGDTPDGDLASYMLDDVQPEHEELQDMSSEHIIHDLREENRALRARIAELQAQLEQTHLND